MENFLFIHARAFWAAFFFLFSKIPYIRLYLYLHSDSVYSITFACARASAGELLGRAFVWHRRIEILARGSGDGMVVWN